MYTHEEKDIPLAKLVLDPENPRHTRLDSQVEIFDWFTSGSGRIGDKLLILAKDIASYGINPSEKIMVVRDQIKSEEYIVIEGNRRIAALKLLNNPDIAPTQIWKDRFLRIQKHGYDPIKTVSCVVFDTREDADHFIELKHLGESGGAGIVPWDPIQKARHEQQRSGKTRNKDALDVLGFVGQSNDFSDKIKQLAASERFPITTLQRLLSDREFRDFLGLLKGQEGIIFFYIDPSEVAKAVSKIITDFGTGTFKVGDVINKDKRREYINKFSENDLPNYSKKLKTPINVPSYTDGSYREVKKTSDRLTIGSKYDDPKNRTKIIIRGFTIGINSAKHNRANRVFGEIKKLPLREYRGKPRYPNAAILLIRTFLEISVDTYIRDKLLKHPSPKDWKDIKLHERIRAVLEDLSRSNILSKQESKVVTKVLSDPHKLANPNSINDLIHNLNQLPVPNDIIDIWDTYSQFLQRLWSTL